MQSPLIPQPKIILEGTSLTLKTDIAFALAEHPRLIGERKHRWHIPLVSSEWETFSDGPPTKANPGRSLITFEPREEARAMEGFEVWMRLFELQRDYYWIVDRFHLSTRVYQMANHGTDYPFDWLDRRLAYLNFLLVHTVRDQNTYVNAREGRLAFSENPHRYVDLGRISSERPIFTDLVAQSRMKTLEVDVSDNDVSRAAEQILDWAESIGAFWDRPWAK